MWSKKSQNLCTSHFFFLKNVNGTGSLWLLWASWTFYVRTQAERSAPTWNMLFSGSRAESQTKAHNPCTALLRSDICHIQPHPLSKASQRPLVTTDPARIVPDRECWKSQAKRLGCLSLRRREFILRSKNNTTCHRYLLSLLSLSSAC